MLPINLYNKFFTNLNCVCNKAKNSSNPKQHGKTRKQAFTKLDPLWSSWWGSQGIRTILFKIGLSLRTSQTPVDVSTEPFAKLRHWDFMDIQLKLLLEIVHPRIVWKHDEYLIFCEICTIIKSFNFTFFLFSEHHLEQIVLETQPTMSKWGTRGTSLGPSIVAKLSTLCSWLVELLSRALNTFKNKMHKIMHEKLIARVILYHSKEFNI